MQEPAIEQEILFRNQNYCQKGLFIGGDGPLLHPSRIRHAKARVPDNDAFTGVLKPGNCVVDPAACVDNKHFSFIRVHYVAF